MYTATAEISAQVFLPQGKSIAKASDPNVKFKDVMNQADNKQNSSAQRFDQNQPAAEDVTLPEKNETKEERNLLLEQMAASLAVPVQFVQVTPENLSEEQVIPLNLQQMSLDNQETADVLETTTVEVEPQKVLSEAVMTEEKPILAKAETKENSMVESAPVQSKDISVSTVKTSETTDGEEQFDQQMQSKDGARTVQKNEEAETASDSMSMEPAGLKTETLDLSKVNVKVSDGPILAESPKFADDVADKILYNVANGKTQFDVELNPGDLGTIRIKMVFESGKATILMSCSNAKTENLLLGSAEQIRSIVESQTGTQATVHVKDDAHQAQQDMDGRGENPNKRQREEQHNQDNEKVDAAVFLQQLKLGLIGKEV